MNTIYCCCSNLTTKKLVLMKKRSTHKSNNTNPAQHMTSSPSASSTFLAALVGRSISRALNLPSSFPLLRTSQVLSLPSARSGTAAAANDTTLQESVIMVEIPSPRTIAPLEQQKHFWAEFMLPYTARAFGETADTITESSKREHFEHAFPGDALFVAVLVKESNPTDDESTLGERKREKDSTLFDESALRVIAHELCDFASIPSFSHELDHLVSVSTASSDDGSKAAPAIRNAEDCRRRCLCVTGICTDPLYQGRNVSSMLHSFALSLSFLGAAGGSTNPNDMASQISCVVLRTVNPAVVKMLRRTSPPGTVFFPDDCFAVEQKEERASISKTAKDGKEETTTASCSSNQWWDTAKVIACALLPQWWQLREQADKFDPEALCFRGAYAADRQKVFVQKKEEEVEEEEKKAENPRSAGPGDAVLRICLFPL